jgi:molybdate transport system substrate-binding protein
MVNAEPPAGEQLPCKEWTVALRVWVERQGQPVLGPGRLELLDRVAQSGSISAAARSLGMSYRRAWELIQAVNAAAGRPLVVAGVGGSGGGGAQLTDAGRIAVETFRDLQDRFQREAAQASPPSHAPPNAAVHVAAAVSLEEVLGQLLSDYTTLRPEARVRALYGASDELADQLLGGARADLYLTADPRQLDRLEAARLLKPGAGVVVAGNDLAAVGLADRVPLLQRAADLARADGLRVALADPACPLGGYTRAYLEGRGLYDRLQSSAVVVENSRAVLAAVRGGQADVGLVYGSDAGRAEGCRLLFRIRRPPIPIRYLAAVLRQARRPQQALDLLAFLTSPRAARRFRDCGFRGI